MWLCTYSDNERRFTIGKIYEEVPEYGWLIDNYGDRSLTAERYNMSWVYNFKKAFGNMHKETHDK